MLCRGVVTGRASEAKLMRNNYRPAGRLGEIFLVVLALLSLGANRYVEPGGSDSGGCTNSSSPCRTIQYAADQANCGDTVLVRNGTYSSGVTAPISCPSSSPLTIKSENKWGAVISTSDGGSGILYSSERNYIVFDGFELRRTGGAAFGVRIRGGTGVKVLNIKDSYPCGGRDSIYATGGRDLLIEGCDVGQNVSNDECTYQNGGCYPTNDIINLTIKDSVCHDVRNFGNQKNIRTALYDGIELRNMHNHGISMYDSSDIVIQRCVLWHTPGNTVTDIGSLFDTYCSQRVEARNNTSRGSSTKITQFYYSFGPVPSECNDGVGNEFSVNDDISVYNNIIYGVKADCLQPGSNMASQAFDSNYNIFHSCGEEIVNQYSTLPQWQQSSDSWARTRDPNSLTDRPTFVDESAGDFRALNENSPQVDAGDNDHCAHVIVNGRCDIGATEFQGGGGGGGDPPSNVSNAHRTDQRQP
jgi:hypothetical protein